MSRLGEAVRRSRALEERLAAAYGTTAERHAAEPDVFHLCTMFGEQAGEHAARLGPFAERHGAGDGRAPAPASDGSDGSLLGDLTRLFVLAQECWIDATIVRQAALAARDAELLDVVTASLEETEAQTKWLKSRVKTTAPQWLTVE
jgi:hypothetical protein